MPIDDIKREAVRQKTGRVLRLEDIDGVGRSTAQKVRAATGASNPKQVSEYSADQLADLVSGLGRKRARKIVRESGGSPSVDERSGQQDLLGMEAPESMRMFEVGDFNLDISEQDSAEAKHERRSQTARRVDRRQRAPITTDLDKWRQNKGKYDYPGVDTPTEEPGLLPKDYKRGGPFETEVEEQSQAPTGKEKIPSGEAERSLLASFDVSLGPNEAFEGKGTESQPLSATRTPNTLAEGFEADMAFMESEKERAGFDAPRSKKSGSSDVPAGVARRESERKAAKSQKDTPGLRRLDSRIRAARGDELDTSDAKFGDEELEELNDLFK